MMKEGDRHMSLQETQREGETDRQTETKREGDEYTKAYVQSVLKDLNYKSSEQTRNGKCLGVLLNEQMENHVSYRCVIRPI